MSRGLCSSYSTNIWPIKGKGTFSKKVRFLGYLFKRISYHWSLSIPPENIKNRGFLFSEGIGRCQWYERVKRIYGQYFYHIETRKMIWIAKQCTSFYVIGTLALNRLRCSICQMQPSRVVLRKRCSENMQQIYRRIPTPKCDFNKVTLQLYWNHTSAWVFSCKFAAYFQNTFSQEHLWKAAFNLY